MTFLPCCVFLASVLLPAAPPAGPYLGQAPPEDGPRIFAPGIVNTGLMTRDITFSPDGRELYFRVTLPEFTRAAIVGCREGKAHWTEPEVPAFAADPRWRTLEPRISPDGARFFFVSDRPADPAGTQAGPMGIWVMERQGGSWGTPRRLPADINGEDGSFSPAPTRGGTLYFARDGKDGAGVICRARRSGEGYAAPEVLPPVVQCGRMRYNPCVAPDESFLILSSAGLPDSAGLDYYILFRSPDDRWSEPIHLGPAVNAPGHSEISSSLSPDGRYLFFASGRVQPQPPAPLTFKGLQALALKPGANGSSAIWWVKADFLEGLRSRAVFPAKP